MGTCSETICKHGIHFPSIQHLAWLRQGRPWGNKNVVKTDFGVTHWSKHRITRKLFKIDRYMLREVWQALNCLSIHATYCVIIAAASPGETKMWAAVRENGDFCTCGSNNWETVKDRWVHAARGLANNELFFHSCNILRDCRRGVPRANKKWRPGYVKMTIFCNGGSNNLETVVDRQLTH